jgi:hypothetical protein
MRAPEMINHIILEPIDKNHLSMANTTQDSAASQPKWSWGLGRSSTTGSANKETTPLLASQSSQADDDSQRPLAPPPSSAPPPPPTEEVPLKSDGADDTSQSALSQKSKSSKSSSRSKRRKNAPDPTVEAVTAASSHIKNTIKKSIKKKFDGPRKPVLHVLLDIVRLLAGLSSLMMLGMQAVPLFGGLKKGEDSEFSFGLQVAVRYVHLGLWSQLNAKQIISELLFGVIANSKNLHHDILHLLHPCRVPPPISETLLLA